MKPGKWFKITMLNGFSILLLSSILRFTLDLLGTFELNLNGMLAMYLICIMAVATTFCLGYVAAVQPSLVDSKSKFPGRDVIFSIVIWVGFFLAFIVPQMMPYLK
jgi:hypothetical protein